MIDTYYLIQKINDAANRRDDAKQKKEDELKARVFELEQEVQDIIDNELSGILSVGQALFNKGFLPAKDHRLTAEGIKHNVGFYGATEYGLTRLRKVRTLAWIGGGYCGEYDVFVAPSGIVYAANSSSCESAKEEPPTMMQKACTLQSFLKGYPKFKEDLGAFVEKLSA